MAHRRLLQIPETRYPKGKQARLPPDSLLTVCAAEGPSGERTVSGAGRGPRGPDLPGPARVSPSQSRQETALASFYPTTCSTLLCQKIRPTMNYAIQQLPLLSSELKKAGSRPNTFWAAGRGSRSPGTSLLPCSPIEIASSCDNQMGLRAGTPTSLASSSEEEGP